MEDEPDEVVQMSATAANQEDEKLVVDYDAILVNTVDIYDNQQVYVNSLIITHFQKIIGGWGWFQRVLYHALCIPVIFSTLMMFTIQGL